MKKIKRFEDIESWKLARKLTGEIYKATSTGVFVRDFGLKDQIRRASFRFYPTLLRDLSVGMTRSSHFLAIAKGSSVRCVPNYMLLWTRDIFRSRRSIGSPS